MRLKMIVDGYNVMHSWDRGRFIHLSKNLEKKREEFISYLQNYQDIQNCSVTVVFDGYSKKNNKLFSSGYISKNKGCHVEVSFSRYKQTADAMIEKIVAQAPNPLNLLVVTADRDIAQLVRGYGSQVWSPDIFERDLRQKLQQMRVDLDEKTSRTLWRIEDLL